MRIVNYGEYFGEEEPDELIAKAKHFVKAAKHFLSVVFMIQKPEIGEDYVTFIALSHEVQLEITIKTRRDIQSFVTINELDLFEIESIESTELTIKQKRNIIQTLDLENNTIKCPNCSQKTLFHNNYCVNCGHKFNKNVKLCKNCKDYFVYPHFYYYCPNCGDSLLEHYDKKFTAFEFDIESLLYGIRINPDYINYDELKYKSSNNGK
jgi:hypothetical protein